MLLSLLPCLLPGLALGLTVVPEATHPLFSAAHADGETTDRQMGRRYDGLSSCDPLANVFIINVAGPTGAKRRARAMAELEKAGISQYIISNAVTPRDFSYPEVLEAGESMRLAEGHAKISEWEAALALSHRNIYNRIVKENRSCALVFEDDFRLLGPSTFKDRISGVRLPAEYDFVKLEYGMYKGLKEDNPPIPAVQIPLAIHVSRPTCCASGYLVSNAGARLLLEANTPLWNNADGNMDANHIKFSAAATSLPVKSFILDPPLSWQSDEFDEGGTFT